MADSLQASQEKLGLLRQNYVQQLPGKISEIEMISYQLLQGQWDVDALKTLHFATHRLAGSSATFGFYSLSNLLRMLEVLVKAILDSGNPPTSEQRSQISALLPSLKKAVLDFNPNKASSKLGTHPPYQQPHSHQRNNRLIFLVEDDPDLAQDLALQIGYFGYTVQVFETPAGLKEAIEQTCPAAIVMDLGFPEGGLAGSEAIAEIQKIQNLPMPILFISVRDDLIARLQAVRAGGNAYFTKPIDISELLDRLDSLTNHETADQYRILIVDDDVPLATYYALTLQQAGILSVVVNDPLEIMQPLVEFRPDLILMDIYMPGCSGTELATVIRQQGAYVGIPILFLSSETDFDKQLIAIRQGGDDFLTKPIQPDHLVASIKPRVERSRVLRSLMERDSLTGLFNHTKIKEQLCIEVQRASRRGTDLAFVMIDIDHFKAVNDSYGHLTGDRVIKNLTRLLQQCLRKADILGRYGGEEFAVILPYTDGPTAVKVLDKIRHGFAKIRHRSENVEFSVTFSGGIAAFPAYQDAVQLNSAADQALYIAKREGRNRIMLASEAN